MMGEVDMATQEHEQQRAMDLARRAYLYGAYHVVFGGGLDAASVPRVFSQETADMLYAVEAALHGEGCAHLASEELTSLQITVRDGVLENIACLEKTMRRSEDRGYAEALADGYANLFRVPGASYVRPWESPYIGKMGMIFQESTLDVRRRYHEAGFKLSTDSHFPDDHIAALLDYEARMSERAYAAYADGDDATARSVLDLQLEMLERHVLTWIDAFAEDVARKDASGVFAAFSFGLDAFLRVDEIFCRSLFDDLENEDDDAADGEGGVSAHGQIDKAG